MNSMMETVRYTYRLRPSKTATRKLEQESNLARWTWNQCVGREKELRTDGYKTPTGYDLCYELTDWRGRNEWLRSGSQNVQANSVLSWGKNRKHAFNIPGRGKPKFKKKHKSLPTLEYTSNGFKIKNGKLVLAGNIVCPVVWHRQLPSKPKSCTVSRKADGYWQVSFVVERECEKFPSSTNKIGVDWGVKSIAVTTNPKHDLQTSGFAKRQKREVAKLNREKSRRYTQGEKSRNYLESKLRLAKLHAKIARQRKHAAIQWVRQVVTDNEFIAVEDFQSKFLGKTKMAFKASDNSVGLHKRELIAYGVRAGRTVVLVPPAYSSQTCSGCGARTKHRLELSDRVFDCGSCFVSLDRDLNAARNVLLRAETVPLGVENVSRVVLVDGALFEPGSPRF
jgi:putative transposase